LDIITARENPALRAPVNKPRTPATPKNTPIRTELSLDPQQSQVLRRLLSAPAQLRLSPANVAQFSALLPGSLKSLFPSEHLLIRSIASNNRVVMLVFADQNGRPLGDALVQGFGKTVQCIERALASFASRAR
jgi:hypothetical protein